jgi:hypothetical protein
MCTSSSLDSMESVPPREWSLDALKGILVPGDWIQLQPIEESTLLYFAI